MRARLVPLVVVATILLALSGLMFYLAGCEDGFTLNAFDFGGSSLWWTGLILLAASGVTWLYTLGTIMERRL